MIGSETKAMARASDHNLQQCAVPGGGVPVAGKARVVRSKREQSKSYLTFVSADGCVEAKVSDTGCLTIAGSARRIHPGCSFALAKWIVEMFSGEQEATWGEDAPEPEYPEYPDSRYITDVGAVGKLPGRSVPGAAVALR